MKLLSYVGTIILQAFRPVPIPAVRQQGKARQGMNRVDKTHDCSLNDRLIVAMYIVWRAFIQKLLFVNSATNKYTETGS